MKTKHTPGPWKVDCHGIITGGPYSCTSIGSICIWEAKNNAEVLNARAKAATEIFKGYQGGMVDEAKGNAHLIAAAPELLEAAKDITAMIDSGFLVRDITKDGQPQWAMKTMTFVMRLNKFVEAIAHAEGGSK